MRSKLKLASFPTPAYLALADDDGDDLLLVGGLTQTLLPGAAVREPVVNGPILDDPDTVIVPIRARLYHRNAPNTPVVTLDQGYSLRWLDQLNEAGSASLILQNDDPDLALIQGGDLVRFDHYGYAAMTMLVTETARISVAESEESGEATTVSGPGHLAVLEESRVYPARGIGSQPIEEDRLFNWAAVDFDDSAWITATVMAHQGDPVELTGTGWFGEPQQWPDPTAAWIWASSGSFVDADPGFCYFRATMNVPTAAQVVIYCTCDNGGDLYLDGMPLITGMNDYHVIFQAETDVSAGDHVIAVAGGNTPDPTNPTNPGGVLCAVFVKNSDLSIGAQLLRSDGTWRIIEYPGYAPGMSPTEVIRHVVDEGQARGELTNVELMFSDVADSNGEPVAAVADIATKTGTDLLTFTRELTATYLDVWMAPGSLELYAWNKGTRGQVTAAQYETAVDLRHLEHRRTETMINAVLVRWAGGWHEVVDAASVTAYGRQGGLLSLGAVQSIQEVERIAVAQLEAYANPRASITLDMVPLNVTDRPYPGFLVGDTITVPDRDGTPVQERVIALTVSQDENAQVSYAPELGFPELAQSDRHEQALKKMSEGTLRGESKVAQPVAAPPAAPPQTLPAQAASLPPTASLRGSATCPDGWYVGLGATTWRQSAGMDGVTVDANNSYEVGKHRFVVTRPCDILLTFEVLWNWGTTTTGSLYVSIDARRVDDVSFYDWPIGPFLNADFPSTQAVGVTQAVTYRINDDVSVAFPATFSPYAVQDTGVTRTLKWKLSLTLLESTTERTL